VGTSGPVDTSGPLWIARIKTLTFFIPLEKGFFFGMALPQFQMAAPSQVLMEIFAHVFVWATHSINIIIIDPNWPNCHFFKKTK